MLSLTSIVQDYRPLLRDSLSPSLFSPPDDHVDLTTMSPPQSPPTSPTLISARLPPPTHSLLSNILSRLFPVPEIKSWLLNRGPSLATSASTLSNSIAFECRWPTGVPQVDQAWSTDPGDLFVCERMINGIALGTIFGQKDRLAYAVASEKVESLGISLQANVRRVAIGVWGDWMRALEFCWMDDGSLIIVGRILWVGNSGEMPGAVSGASSKDIARLRGELWVFRQGPKEGFADKIAVPDRAFTFTEVALPECTLCRGKGCILCFSTGVSVDNTEEFLRQGQGQRQERFSCMDISSNFSLQRQHQLSRASQLTTWNDITKKLGVLYCGGHIDVHYFKNGTNALARHTLTINGADNSHYGGVLSFSHSFRIPFSCKSANESTTAQLHQAYMTRLWSAHVGLRSNVKLWSSYVNDQVDPIVSAAAEVGINLTSDTARAGQIPIFTSGGIVQEIKGLVGEGAKQGMLTDATQQRDPRGLPLQLPRNSIGATSLSRSSAGANNSSQKSDDPSTYTRKVGERDFRCTLCNKSFVKRSNAVRHRQTVHEKIRPFKCSVCKTAFGHRTHLTRHQASRHGMVIAKAPRRRQPAGSAASQAALGLQVSRGDSISGLSNLLDDQNRPNEEEKVSCTMCNLSFAHRSALNRHIRSTHQRRRVQCLLCYADFGQMSDLDRHFRRKHPACSDTRRYSSVVFKGFEEPTSIPLSSRPEQVFTAPTTPSYPVSYSLDPLQSTSQHQQYQQQAWSGGQSVLSQGSVGLSLFTDRNTLVPSNAATNRTFGDNSQGRENNPNVSDSSITTSTTDATHVTQSFSCA